MRKNWIHYSIATIFFLFGIVQYNDPDFYKWLPAYFIIASVPIMYAKYAFPEKTVIALTVIWAIWLGFYIPDIMEWFNQGMPSITGSMKAESPFIELAREFFGLLLCFVTLIFYLILFKKRNK
jgi:hypothetical protein